MSAGLVLAVLLAALVFIAVPVVRDLATRVPGPTTARHRADAPHPKPFSAGDVLARLNRGEDPLP